MGAKEDYERIKQFADDFGFDDEWVNEGMKHRGHKPSLSWSDAEEEESGSSWGGSKRESTKREVPPRGRREPKESSGPWGYSS